ncbi:hypothetical protein B0A50_04442 [Salinomyces thailandicus]|uniref:Uncharacterized protein n=1 Tax=Salinomyces thailandicus TaxID=706561 RepID=A0A4U0TYK2_9PEZI|nr:hypothetical protein B0A50_04442 [Salinomyces thailandica]
MGAVASCFNSVVSAITACFMAVVNAIVTVVKAIISGIVAIFYAIASVLTCGKVKRGGRGHTSAATGLREGPWKSGEKKQKQKKDKRQKKDKKQKYKLAKAFTPSPVD